MMAAAEDSLFGGIALSLAELRAEVTGASGADIRAMGPATGVVADIVRRAVGVIADILAWLYDISVKAEHQLIQADAAIAALEVMSEAVEAFAEGLQLDTVALSFGISPKPFRRVGEAIERGQDAVEKGLDIAKLLPRPDDLRDIRRELELLLGGRVKPDIQPPGLGVLGDLQADIAPPAAVGAMPAATAQPAAGAQSATGTRPATGTGSAAGPPALRPIPNRS